MLLWSKRFEFSSSEFSAINVGIVHLLPISALLPRTLDPQLLGCPASAWWQPGGRRLLNHSLASTLYDIPHTLFVPSMSFISEQGSVDTQGAIEYVRVMSDWVDSTLLCLAMLARAQVLMYAGPPWGHPYLAVLVQHQLLAGVLIHCMEGADLQQAQIALPPKREQLMWLRGELERVLVFGEQGGAGASSSDSIQRGPSVDAAVAAWMEDVRNGQSPPCDPQLLLAMCITRLLRSTPAGDDPNLAVLGAVLAGCPGGAAASAAAAAAPPLVEAAAGCTAALVQGSKLVNLLQEWRQGLTAKVLGA